jgi:hypothetical protein
MVPDRYRNVPEHVPVAGLAAGQARRQRRGGLVAVARIAAHGGEAGRPLRPDPAALMRAVGRLDPRHLRHLSEGA